MDPAVEPLIVLADPAQDRTLARAADDLAAGLGLPRSEAPVPAVGLALVLTATHLELRALEPRGPRALRVDFLGGAYGYRRRQGFSRSEPLARAAGLRRHAPGHVLDATPGLGRDAFLLASLGCSVTAVERHPVVAALLGDALRRAQATTELAPVVDRIALVTGDARGWLASQPPPDVVVLDPMFPERHGSALVRKDMRLVRRLVGDDPDAAELLAAALATGAGRVVVRRPAGAASLPASRAPDLAVTGRRTRYDVYLSRARTGA